jgi:hypothetical protein
MMSIYMTQVINRPAIIQLFWTMNYDNSSILHAVGNHLCFQGEMLTQGTSRFVRPEVVCGGSWGKNLFIKQARA